jgi:hypothetical protein
MGIGYVLGCLASISAWKFDRQVQFIKVNKKLEEIVNNKLLLQGMYIILGVVLCFLMYSINIKEISNFITAFLVIDVSNSEKKSLSQKERIRFYDSISSISRALVCGFIAPLFVISILGNAYGIGYMLIYNIKRVNDEYNLIKHTLNILNVIPCLIAELFLYFVYSCRNRRYKIDFKGDFFTNLFMSPLLNVDILGAYIESVNFYYLYSCKSTACIKSYGEYTKKIDEVCVKDYLSITYGICLLVFILFCIYNAKVLIH